MSTVAEWDQIYNNTLEMLSKVKSALDPRSGTKDFAKVQTQLDIIANKISALEGSLNSANTQGSKIKLAERDLRRRSNMVAGLKREKADCDGKMVSMGGNLKRKEQLFNSNFDSEKISKQSDAELHNMQEQIFAHQEQALVDISDVLGRLHDIGTAIGDEADAHVKLLDEMDGNVDVANNRLAQESKRAKQVSKNTSMCKWYSVIVLLLISLIYLIVYYIKM